MCVCVNVCMCVYLCGGGTYSGKYANSVSTHKQAPSESTPGIRYHTYLSAVAMKCTTYIHHNSE